MARAAIVGTGSALPAHRITNADWEARLDTTDAWIQRRTGIRERRWLNGDETLAQLAARACEAALVDAGLAGADVDHVVVATITADQVTPGLGPEVARLLGAPEVAAMDVNAACAGFLYGLEHAAALIESGRAACVVVCGAEALSRLTDVADRGTAVLFGDGAGAVVVVSAEVRVGCGSFVLGSDGTHADALYAGREERLLRMDGQQVYRHAVARMSASTSAALERAGVAAAELDLLIAHQANARIVEAVAAELGLDDRVVVVDLAETANTSSATIPLALARAQDTGRLRPGALVGLAAFGAGFVWGAGVVGYKEAVRVAA